MKKNMVICGASGINNSGDEAILDVLLFRYSADYDVKVISINASKAKEYHKDTVFINIKDTAEVKNAISQSDILLIGGGCLFQDETSVFNIFRWSRICKMAIDMGKKTVIYANSFGPLNYKSSRKKVKKLLDKCDLITLRDTSSFELLKELGVSSNYIVTADPVFSYPLKQESIDSYNLPKKYITISVRHWFDTIPFIPVSLTSKIHYKKKSLYNEYINSINNIINAINDNLDLPVVLIPFLTERDYAVCNDIMNVNGKTDYNCILGDGNKQICPNDIIRIIGDSEFLVGMRLHSIIFAALTATPFIAIDYSAKVNGMLKELDMEEYSINLKDCKTILDSFIPEMESLMNNNDAVRKRLSSSFERMRSQERLNYSLVNELWNDNDTEKKD